MRTFDASRHGCAQTQTVLVSFGKHRWETSRERRRTSNALDLEPNVFTWSDPKRVARSLKRSAETRRRRKALPFQSAMSMLNFYLNRTGRGLSAKQRRVLTQAKTELRRLFGKMT